MDVAQPAAMNNMSSIAVATLVAFLSAPIAAWAQPVPPPVLESSSGLKAAAWEGLPFVVPGLGISAAGGVLLAKALGAATAAGTVTTFGAVALPFALIAVGGGLLVWGSNKIYRAISAKNVSTRPTTPPTNVPGTNPNPPGNGPGAPSNNGPRIGLPPGVVDVDIRVSPAGVGSPISTATGGNNSRRNDATRPSASGRLPGNEDGAGTAR